MKLSIRCCAEIILFLLFFPLILVASPQKTDSLLRLYREATVDTVKVSLLNQVAGEYLLLQELELAGKYTDEAISLGEKISWTKGLMDAYETQGHIFYDTGDPGKSVGSYEKSLLLAEREKNPDRTARYYNDIAIAYSAMGNSVAALEYYYKSLHIYEQLKSDLDIGDTYNNIGVVYMLQEDFDKALEFIQKSHRIRLKINDPARLATSYGNLGVIYASTGDYRNAIINYRKNFELKKKLNSEVALAAYNTGQLFLELARQQPEVLLEKIPEYYSENNKTLLDSAYYYLLMSYELDFNSGNPDRMLKSLMGLADYWYTSGNYLQALQLYKKCEAITDSADLIYDKKDTYQGLYLVYKELSDKAKALDYFEKFVTLRDSILNEEKAIELSRKEFQYEFEKKSLSDSLHFAEQERIGNLKHEEDIKRQKFYTTAGLIGFALMLAISFISYGAYRSKKRSNKIITDQKKMVEEQKQIVEEKQKEILDSINYAKRIQYALLAHHEFLEQHIPDLFVLFKPKDIVSGDFYWATKKENRFYLAVCDSTGHGVPGAFMSLLNISFLNEAITEKNIEHPDQVLNHVRSRLVDNISHDGARDGMDAVLICMDQDTGEVTYAAAHNGPLLIRNSEAIKLPADKMPVGKDDRNIPFTRHKIDIREGDMLYLYTDGYADQFGGEKNGNSYGKKFKEANLKKLLLSIHSHPLTEQKELLEKKFNEWRGSLEQVDDLCLVGLKPLMNRQAISKLII